MAKEQKFSDALAVQVERRIFLVRGQKVMLDTDLAELYRVPTKSLNLAVKRNADRFPEDFMFQLTDDEAAGLRFHFETSKRGRGGRRYLPYAFTEQGVAMLSSVLRSSRAVQVNIAIMRTFVRCARCSYRIRNLPASLPRSKTSTTPSLRSSSTPSAN